MKIFSEMTRDELIAALLAAREEVKFQGIFNLAFADKLKEFGTVDRLIEEYSAAKMKVRAAETKLEAAETALRKARDHTPAIPGPFMTIRDILNDYFAGV